MDATPSSTTPPLVCPRCSAQGPGPRCAKDRAYMVTAEALREAQGDTTLGTEIGGRYGVTERLGMGGMGAVYKAVDLKRGLTVAVKVLREAYAKHPAIRERFVREAEAGASLQHPNVVPLVDFGVEASGRLWLAMEYVKGWTLRDEINHNGAFSVRAAIELTRQVLKGLAAAHDAGLVHRDLKHDNLMYFGSRSSFTVRIVDFGVVKSEAADLMRGQVGVKAAKSPAAAPAAPAAARKASGGVFDINSDDFDLSSALADAEEYAAGRAPAAPAAPAPAATQDKPEDSAEGEALAKELTAAGMMVGSPSYMAPEQIRGLKVGPPADLYALAVVVYEVLAARRLFTVNDYETLLREGAKRDAPLLVFSAKGELIPEPFAQMINRALAHDPTDRYPDAHTMLLALDQMSLKSSALPVNLLSRVPALDEARGVGGKEAAREEPEAAREEPGAALAPPAATPFTLPDAPPAALEPEPLARDTRAESASAAPERAGLGALWALPAAVFIVTLASAYLAAR